MRGDIGAILGIWTALAMLVGFIGGWWACRRDQNDAVERLWAMLEDERAIARAEMKDQFRAECERRD